ncbi:MAG: hypothetical protein OEZ09_11760, partial [Betaproteobacteria bacterium]|nr:hypothetical protein [Betaproteobacteria bacterium]
MRPASIPLRLEEVAVDLAEDHASPRPAQSLHRRHAALESPARQLELLNRVPLRAEFHALAPAL